MLPTTDPTPNPLPWIQKVCTVVKNTRDSERMRERRKRRKERGKEGGGREEGKEGKGKEKKEREEKGNEQNKRKMKTRSALGFHSECSVGTEMWSLWGLTQIKENTEKCPKSSPGLFWVNTSPQGLSFPICKMRDLGGYQILPQ